jgi:hypothetical protein
MLHSRLSLHVPSSQTSGFTTHALQEIHEAGAQACGVHHAAMAWLDPESIQADMRMLYPGPPSQFEISSSLFST